GYAGPMIPTGSQPVAEVVVGRERDCPGGWEFEVTIRRGEACTEHRVRLSWVDYEYWSHGAAAPERVVRAAVESILDLASAPELPETFDAAAGRRWVGGLDERVRERLY